MTARAGERLLFVNGDVVTLDPVRPRAEAVYVEGGSVAYAGGLAQARAAAGADARVVDLDGAVLRPAYHDGHTHLAAASVELAQLDLRGIVDAEEAAARVAEAARRASRGGWVRGFGWDEHSGRGPHLTRAVLDAASPDRPVLIGRGDGHAVVANSAALAALGLHGSDGDGVLVEAEATRARASAPAPSHAARIDALERALLHAAALGIARLDDVVEAGALDLYARLREDGRLPCRIGGWIPLASPEDEADDLRRRFPPGDPWIEVATRKVFLDGTLGARTAALGAPYADAPGTSGALAVDPRDLEEGVRAADAGGWAVAFHAIGDAAVRLALDVLERLPPRRRLRPHRVEHVQVAAVSDLPRFRTLGAVASIQPAHHAGDAPFAASRLGTRPGIVSYPAASLLRAGAHLAFGSDWPVGPLDPAVTRRAVVARTDGEGLDGPQALRAATQGPAFAAGRPPSWGTIAPGTPADLVVVEPGGDDVVATFAGGRPTWSRRGI